MLLKVLTIKNECGNLLFNLNQQHNMTPQTPKRKKPGNVRIAVTLWCVCVTIVDMKKL
jgi:hypothetical protein